jgi:4'-phosphopantetheinyl transferase
MRIDIYCAFCERITDPLLLARYRQLLTEEELSRQVRFYFEPDRHRFLITRALLRTTLSRYADIPPERWRFVTNAYGRPYVANEGAAGLTFNLSHTRKLVVLAVTRGCELGVDTEDTVTRTPPLAIADRFFAPEEAASLRALPAEQRAQRFFQHWTLKESYIKARGMGLSLPLDGFAFHFPAAQQVRLTVQASLQDAAENWHLWQWWLQSAPARAAVAAQLRHHMLALCAQQVPGDPPELVLRDVVPLVSEDDVRSALIARSQSVAASGPEA